MALQLAKMFGGSADNWLNLERTYALHQAVLELAEQLGANPELRASQRPNPLPPRRTLR
ncbi:hypothetical protein [Sphingomonas ursincola]|uniref:hypothetical protein n=1 Tax=Sphingomonas ursincola TaxID=56361 RepID=UPI00235309D8|nr:hypothetical protein [Sphingomonas ursincola]MBY0621437.1 hypothetical protein [Sphingomonas ursincola]